MGLMNIDRTNNTEVNTIISKEIAVLFFVLIISSAFMYFGAAQLYKETKIIKMANGLKEKNIESKELILSKITKFGGEGEKIDNDNLEKINNLISNRNNYEDYFAHIVKLAYNDNITVSDFSFLETQKKIKMKDKDLGEGTISFLASGGFLNFMHFLDSIENGIPFIQEESVSIDAGAVTSEATSEGEESRKDPSPILDCKVSFKFYFY